MDDDDEIRRARFARVKAAFDADLHSVTILRVRRYLAQYADHGYAWYLLGRSLSDLARYDEAEEALGHALRLCPEHKKWIPLTDLGEMEKQRGRLDRAAEWFRKAIESDPTQTSGYIFLGGVLALQGRLREAEAVHREAIASCYEGDFDEAFLNLGLVLRAQERFGEAAECFREAIRRDPNDKTACRALRDVERCFRMLNRHR